jgi:hypothetical protein
MRRSLILLLAVLATLVGASSALADGDGHGKVTATLTATPDPVTAGTPVALVTTFTNGTSAKLHNVTLAAPAPAGMSVVTVVSAGSCTTSAGEAVCSFGDLPAGASASARVIMNAPSSPGTANATFTWSAGDGDHDADDQDIAASTSFTIKAPDPDSVSEYVLPAGGTVSTGSTTSQTNPQSTAVSVPSTPAGTPTTLTEMNAAGPSDACGAGATCFGQISIVTVGSGPFPATDPLHLTFLIDAGELPRRIDLDDIQMFHDGVLVPDCTGGPGVASPASCVSARKLVSSKHSKHPKHCKKHCSVEIDVLSTTNGRWRP